MGFRHQIKTEALKAALERSCLTQPSFSMRIPPAAGITQVGHMTTSYSPEKPVLEVSVLQLRTPRFTKMQLFVPVTQLPSGDTRSLRMRDWAPVATVSKFFIVASKWF